MIKSITVTVKLDTSAPKLVRVTEFKGKTEDYEFVSDSVPLSIYDAARMFELALLVETHEKE